MQACSCRDHMKDAIV